MDSSNIHLINHNLVLASAEEVTQLEQQLGAKMPDGYQEFVTTLGLGILKDAVRIYMPNRISRELNEFQQRWDEYWFCDKGRDILSKEKAMESIIIADTIIGDELVFHPLQPNKLYILPHNSDQIFEPGSNLDEAIEWILHSGVLFSDGDDEEEDEDFVRPDGMYFEPFPSEQ
jgi:hypothetical protein